MLDVFSPVTFRGTIRWLLLGAALLLAGCTVKFVLIERVEVLPGVGQSGPPASQPR